MEGQVEHTSPGLFAKQLGQVWKNVGVVCVPGAQMIIRFGGINDREADHLPILDDSLQGSGWAIEKIESVGSASQGHRQTQHINSAAKPPREEHDVWTVWQGCGG